MKNKSTLIHYSLFLIHFSLACSCGAAEYTVSGTRYLRKYTAPQKSQVYMAEVDAQRIANKMCDVMWEKSEVTQATATTHVTTNLDCNVGSRESFDAALFCANHKGDEHIAYANAACYVFEFPVDGAFLPTLTNLEMTVYSDPYNAYGARISVVASDRLEIPTDCATVRGDVAGGIRATGVCQRVTRTSGNSSTWYPATTNVVFGSGGLGGSGLQLKRYLFVFVLMENYATSRGNWLEGCSWIENEIKINTSWPIPGMYDESAYASLPFFGGLMAFRDVPATLVELWDGTNASTATTYVYEGDDEIRAGRTVQSFAYASSYDTSTYLVTTKVYDLTNVTRRAELFADVEATVTTYSGSEAVASAVTKSSVPAAMVSHAYTEYVVSTNYTATGTSTAYTTTTNNFGGSSYVITNGTTSVTYEAHVTTNAVQKTATNIVLTGYVAATNAPYAGTVSSNVTSVAVRWTRYEYAYTTNVVPMGATNETRVLKSSGSGNGWSMSPSDVLLPNQSYETVTNHYGISSPWITTWDCAGATGIGTNVSSLAFRKVKSVTNATARLVHRQVYDRFGFDETTCTQGGNDTKEMTREDKMAVIGYHIATGIHPESDPYKLKPHTDDFDGDGIPDGWELYVGTDPYDASNADSDADEDGLSLSEEWDGGNTPTDPNAKDTDGDSVIDLYAYRYHLKGGHASEDWDGDGLSNYAEYIISEVYKFAQLDPDKAKTNGSCVDFFRKFGDLYLGEMFSNFKSPYAEPVSIDKLNMTVRYTGKRRVHAPVIVKCWMVSRDPEMTGFPDRTWTTEAFTLNGTHVKVAEGVVEEGLESAISGKCRYVAFSDMDGSGDFTPGEPFAYWEDGAVTSHDVTLTDSSKMFARVDLTNGSTDYTGDQYANVTVKDIGNDFSEINVHAVGNVSGNVRVRVVRATVNGQFAYEHTYDEEYTFVYDDPHAVVLDKYMDLSARSYLHEGDFFDTGKFDVDWDYGMDEIWKNKRFFDATNVTYLIVIGECEIGSNKSNAVFRCAISRNYDTEASRQNGFLKPVIDATAPVLVYGEHPTFRWTMQDMNGINAYNSYSAFKIQIGTWTSDWIAAPARDVGGWYSWTLDRPLGTLLGTSGTYTWNVAMYNAKFKDEAYWKKRGNPTFWSDGGTITVNMNSHQPMNDFGYSSIAAAAKYTGPEDVVLVGKVVVQAFTTADFAGVPAGAAYATGWSDVASPESVDANAEVKGLPQTGTYYLRAFIDSNGNGQKDDWESWGAAKEPVTLTPMTITRPTVGIFIEDADTDGDWLPDAWEYLKYGNLTAQGAKIMGGDKIVFSGTVDASGKSGISTGLSGASLTIFQNQSFIKSMVGLADVVSIDDVRKAVEKKVNPKTVKITAMTLAPDGRSVTLSVAAEVTDSIAGELLGRLYDITAGDTATVTVKVYKKNTLAEADWTLAWTAEGVSVGRGDTEVTVPVNGVDMTSGFYKIEVVQ